MRGITFVAVLMVGIASPMVDGLFAVRDSRMADVYDVARPVAIVAKPSALTVPNLAPARSRPSRKPAKAKRAERQAPPVPVTPIPHPSPLPRTSAPVQPPPPARPTLTLQHKQVLAKLTSNGVRDGVVTYHPDVIEFAGRKSVAFLWIPFRMSGRFVRVGNFLAFRISTLTISGSPASDSRIASVQSRLERMVPIPKETAPSGNPDRSGRVEILDGGGVVYRQEF